ncbi:hypothetical protein GCM10023260_10000 [Bartonella acomydis]|uniref:Uncharacterized protein n=1 Tax=Bartonella acomydis TaxID=686234 RepID=A0ABP9MNA6_9HYPH
MVMSFEYFEDFEGSFYASLIYFFSIKNKSYYISMCYYFNNTTYIDNTTLNSTNVICFEGILRV